jgi:predicted small metal-binding protein
VINCKDVGVDCEFAAQGATIEEVIEQCADHGRTMHGMHSFDQRFYAKVRACIHVVEADTAPPPGVQQRVEA